MFSEKFDIKGLFGVFGVGSLIILGIFFILNGTIELWDTLEAAIELKGWNVLVSVPLVVVSYLFGIIAIEIADVFLRTKRAKELDIKTIQQLAKENNQFLQSLYFENQQTQRLLKGGAVAFIFISIGSLLNGLHWSGIGILGIVGSVGALALTIICLIISKLVRIDFIKTMKLTE